MQFQTLPLECQIEIVKHFPLYRTLCKLYNNNCENIFYNYYGTRKISYKELKNYIDKNKPAEFMIFYHNNWRHVKLTYCKDGNGNDRVVYDNYTYTLKTGPDIFQEFYTNNIRIDKHYHFDTQLILDINTANYYPNRVDNVNNLLFLSHAITVAILKNRLNCTNINYIEDFVARDKQLYCQNHLYNNDINTFISKLKCHVFNDIYYHNLINTMKYNISFYKKTIHPNHKEEYDTILKALF